MFLISPFMHLLNSSTKQERPFGKVEITFRLERQPYEGSNQYAVWIQNQRGQVVKTLFVTRYAAQGGFRVMPDCIPLWVNRADAFHLSQNEIDGFSGATPQSGWQTYIWDGTDENGKRVPFGNYVFYIEGTYHWTSRVVYSGLILTGGPEITVHAQAEFDSEEHDIYDSGLIERVRVSYIP
ncbi:MAG: DUF2271 domain-containing protein [Tannerellaceae bacterium]|nr:DUF2271 domain-containing protein [Tannerellaceae bacterium]